MDRGRRRPRSFLPGLKEIWFTYDDGDEPIREQGVADFKTYSDIFSKNSAIVSGLPELIVAINSIKNRHPEWKEPVMKSGWYILGSTIGSSGVEVLCSPDGE